MARVISDQVTSIGCGVKVVPNRIEKPDSREHTCSDRVIQGQSRKRLAPPPFDRAQRAALRAMSRQSGATAIPVDLQPKTSVARNRQKPGKTVPM